MCRTVQDSAKLDAEKNDEKQKLEGGLIAFHLLVNRVFVCECGSSCLIKN